MPKDSDVVECIGCIDEANAFIGLAKNFASDDETKQILERVQGIMFHVGAEVSSGKEYVQNEDYIWLIETIEKLRNELEIPKSFLVLEKSRESAFLSVARCIVRRAERRAVKLYRGGLLRLAVVEWLNKLSYLLYLLTLKELHKLARSN